MGSTDDIDEVTAWHEAGHAWAALFVGARVQSVSSAPDNDDGPRRFGDTTILWNRRRFPPAVLAKNLCWVALAGPVAEMIHTGRRFHPGVVAEWQQDWQAALQALQPIRDPQKRLARAELITIQLHEAFSDDYHWSAIGAIADHLLAHEILDEELLAEAVEPWITED